MNSNLIEAIRKIKDKDYSQFSERAIEQFVILKILSNLGWDVFDSEEVYPQHPVDTGRVDYSLKLNGSNKVFIEVKRTTEELEKHQEQLLNYSFRSGINIAILTNGIDWWFYLPLLNQPWEQRKFYSINLKSQLEEEVSSRFIEFLSKENIQTDKAIEFANQYHSSSLKRKIVIESIPSAWNTLIKDRNDLLVELLSEETEKKCGFLPEKEIIYKFLDSIKNDHEVGRSINEYVDSEEEEEETNYTSESQVTNGQYGRRTRRANTKLKVTINHDKIIQEGKAIDTFIKTIQYFGIENVKQRVSTNSVYPMLVSNVELKNYDSRFYKKIAENIYVYSNTNNPSKKQYLEIIADQLKQVIKVEIVTQNLR